MRCGPTERELTDGRGFTCLGNVVDGQVLTAYVGIDGLIYQMALDGCLPDFLLTKNKWRGTNHWIILVYLALATSQVLIMEGDVDALAGVYR